MMRNLAILIDAYGTEYGWKVSDVLDLTLSEIYLINDARTLRDNQLYKAEKESEKNSKKGSRSNFSKSGNRSDNASSGNKKGGALGAEQALSAFQSGTWSKK